MIKDIYLKWRFDNKTDRLGPDCPFSHWKLLFRNTRQKLCRNKFYRYADSADFRPGAYAINCSRISIGENVVIRPGSMLFADSRGSGPLIILEDNVMLGSGVHIYTANHRYELDDLDIIFQGHSEEKKVVIKKGAWIGANCIILPGVVVGENSVVGAGSVVTKSILPRCVYGGNPARLIKKV